MSPREWDNERRKNASKTGKGDKRGNQTSTDRNDNERGDHYEGPDMNQRDEE